MYKAIDINFDIITLICVTDYHVIGNVLIIPNAYREYIFNSVDEKDNFIKNNSNLDLTNGYVIPQLVSLEEGECRGIKHILYL